MRRLVILLSIVSVLLIGITTTYAHRDHDSTVPESGYDLAWYTVENGGAMNAGSGSYSLSGTIGQPDAGVLSGGSYALAGGFWGGLSVNYKTYLPLVVKGI